MAMVVVMNRIEVSQGTIALAVGTLHSEYH
jgi:hypothetical protein